ncbi:hypothetical protein D3C86_2079060 [compost metagenome]
MRGRVQMAGNQPAGTALRFMRQGQAGQFKLGQAGAANGMGGRIVVARQPDALDHFRDRIQSHSVA